MPDVSKWIKSEFYTNSWTFASDVKITLLRVIPTMTFIHFLTGKSSGILSDISSDILFGILSGISSGICSGISSGISSGILSGKSSGILSGISSGILSLTSFLTFFSLRSGSAHCDLEVAVEVRQCPLRPGSRGWGPAVPTAICNSRLRSGSAHWDLERGGGPAVPTGIWTARRRRRVRRRRRQRRRRRRRRRRTAHKI